MNKFVTESRAAQGFSYIGLLFLIALISLLASSSVQLGSVLERREAEEQLLAIGYEYKAAVRSYFENTPVGTPSSAPKRFEDLLRDPRLPGTKRHLRKLYVDPLTGGDWGVVRANDGGILGVYSKASGVPLRQDNLPDEFFHFKGAKSYRRWVFVYGVVCTDVGCELPGEPPPTPVSSPANN